MQGFNSSGFGTRRVAALALAAGLSTGTAFAASVSSGAVFAIAPNDWSSSLLLSKFDSSLGTLNGVQVNWTASSSAEVTIDHGAGAGSVSFSALGSDINFAGNTFVINALVADPNVVAFADGASSPTLSTTNVFAKSGVLLVNPSDWSAYSAAGGGTFNLSFDSTRVASLAGTSVNVTNVSDLTFGGGNLEVVYNYAPIPEPSTYAMMALGLLLTGALQARRRERKD